MPEQSHQRATGIITRAGDTEASGEEKNKERPTDFAQMADQIWPYLRRRLRVEREREHGFPS